MFKLMNYEKVLIFRYVSGIHCFFLIYFPLKVFPTQEARDVRDSLEYWSRLEQFHTQCYSSAMKCD